MGINYRFSRGVVISASCVFNHEHANNEGWKSCLAAVVAVVPIVSRFPWFVYCSTINPKLWWRDRKSGHIFVLDRKLNEGRVIFWFLQLLRHHHRTLIITLKQESAIEIFKWPASFTRSARWISSGPYVLCIRHKKAIIAAVLIAIPCTIVFGAALMAVKYFNEM